MKSFCRLLHYVCTICELSTFCYVRTGVRLTHTSDNWRYTTQLQRKLIAILALLRCAVPRDSDKSRLWTPGLFQPMFLCVLFSKWAVVTMWTSRRSDCYWFKNQERTATRRSAPCCVMIDWINHCSHWTGVYKNKIKRAKRYIWVFRLLLDTLIVAYHVQFCR